MASSVPSPKTILRGHKAQVHAASFIRNNERLLTADAEGYVVLWDLTIMRPRAVWRAHENAVLGVTGWGEDRIITHGRDHKLLVWKVAEEDEEGLSIELPLVDRAEPRKTPWLLHMLSVNTMNFCSFAACPQDASSPQTSLKQAPDILVAVPNTLQSEAVDIYQLPNQERLHTIKSPQKNGMAMSLGLLHLKRQLTLVAAFENGFASVHRLTDDGQWILTYRSQPHSQPVLSLSICPDGESFITSAADAVIAKHPIPVTLQEVTIPLTPQTRITEEVEDGTDETSPSLLSAGLRQNHASRGTGSASSSTAMREWEHPLKVINTKHAGQQSLEVRSDGRIFATAGWDSNIRIYSAKTLRELAVLQWHKTGCFAVAFAHMAVTDASSEASGHLLGGTSTSPADLDKETALVSRTVHQITQRSLSVKEKRLEQARTAHWIAAGSKDGKVSLWDIY